MNDRRSTYFKSFLGCLALLALAGSAIAQNRSEEASAGGQLVTVETEYAIPPDRTLLEAQQHLVQQARRLAIEKVTGVNVQVADVMMTTESGNELFESYRQLIRNVVKGRIVNEQVPEFSQSAPGILKLRYTCEVVEEVGDPDPGFRVELTSNKKVFTVGEELILEARATMGAYLTIFSITEEGRVSMIFPNQYMSQNKVDGGETRVIPDERERRILSFTMQPAEGSADKKYSELLLCIATKEKIVYDELQNRLSYDSDWIELNKWLLRIPRYQWTEDYVQYQVFPK